MKAGEERACLHISPYNSPLSVAHRAVTVADFYHRGGNGPTTASGAVL